LLNNYFTLKQKDIIIFSHPRTVNVDEELIDIYTKYFIDELLESGKEIVEFESAHLGVHKKAKQNFAHYTDWIALAQRIYKQFLKVKILDDKLEVLRKVENEINTVCETNMDLISFSIKNIKTYKANYTIYNKIFQRVKPKTFYTVVSYGQAPIIKAAKDNAIQVIELQHGTFSKYHLGYSFPNRKEPLEYFPDKFYVWNDFWKEMIKLPIADECVVSDSFRYVEKQKSKFIHFEKKENQLIVLSQGAIGNAIAEKLLEHYERFKNYEIKYKLHPGEFDRWKTYSALVKLSKYKNIEIVKNETHLYELFATSSLQIGVFSTALYEGVEFGCDTILFDLNGIEYMDRFVELYGVEVLCTHPHNLDQL
jgi:predicted SprT family Zn-dependent metalloprotease